LALGSLATKARSDVLSLSLPAGLVSGLVDALEHLRSSADRERRGALDELERALAAGRAPGEPRRITARRDLLRELVAVALDEAADALSVDSAGLLRGERSAGELRDHVAAVTGLLDLLEALDAGG
jgi:hypothetical protein